MTIESARTALKTFFEAERELTASFTARAITRVTYLISLQGLRDGLCEKSYLCIVVLRHAEDFLDNPGVYLGAEHRKRAEEMGDAYPAWLEQFRKANTERIALTMLEAVAGLSVPPFPERNPHG